MIENENDNNEFNFEDIPSDLEEYLTKAWYKSKTIVGNGIIAIGGISTAVIDQLLGNSNEILQYLKSMDIKWWILGITIVAILNVINRKVSTNQSIKKG